MKLTDDIKKTRCIGITGGVGSGKSSVLAYLKEKTGCRVYYADEEAKKLYVPGSIVYDRVIETAGRDILDQDGNLDKKAFAAKLFHDGRLREEINAIVHPAMQSLILDEMAYERAKGLHDFFFIEAALLIECGYEELLDEIWYVYASDKTREARLMSDRGYSREKVKAMFDSQMSDKAYREHSARIIDNDGSLADMRASVDRMLEGL